VLFERFEINVGEGAEADFVALMAERGVAFLRGVPGVGTVQFGRGVENPSKFLLLVEWASMAAHETFKASPARVELGKMLAPFVKGGAMEHFEMN
jgi:heme-degrading monooxygenase HmoA